MKPFALSACAPERASSRPRSVSAGLVDQRMQSGAGWGEMGVVGYRCCGGWVDEVGCEKEFDQDEVVQSLEAAEQTHSFQPVKRLSFCGRSDVSAGWLGDGVRVATTRRRSDKDARSTPTGLQSV